MVTFAPKMTAAPVADVLVHHSGAFHVNIVTMTNVGRNMDIVRSMGLAIPIGRGAPTLNARFLPKLESISWYAFSLLYMNSIIS